MGTPFRRRTNRTLDIRYLVCLFLALEGGARHKGTADGCGIFFRYTSNSRGWMRDAKTAPQYAFNL